VEESGFGKYSSDPDVIADTVSSWLASPETLKAMREAALKAARPQSTLDIARELADILFKSREAKQLEQSFVQSADVL
jgi:1,2-diacylglycerol 3-beta-galactosyltransferase